MAHLSRLIYVRGGDLPPRGRSQNFLTGELEPGVSVCEAVERDGVVQILMPYGTHNQFEYSACDYSSMYGRPVYEVEGSLIPQRGSVGEPLLTDVKIVRQLSLCSTPWNIIPYKEPAYETRGAVSSTEDTVGEQVILT